MLNLLLTLQSSTPKGIISLKKTYSISSFYFSMGPIKIINNILTNMTTSVNTTIPNDASATTTPEHQHVTTTDIVEANPEDWHFIRYAIALGIAFACISLWIFREYIMEVCYVQ